MEENQPIEARKFLHCPNCDTKLQADWTFCPNCGQENVDKNVSFRVLFVDFLGDFFTFDSSFFRSLIPFLFKPGEMTREYMQGRRARYIPPVRILVFLSIILVALLSRLVSVTDWDSNGVFNDGGEATVVLKDSLGNPSDTMVILPEITFDETGFNINLNPQGLDSLENLDTTQGLAELVPEIGDSIFEHKDSIEVEDTPGRNSRRLNALGDALKQIPELSKAGLTPEAVVDSILGEKSDAKADDKLILGLLISKRKVLLQAAKVQQSGGSGLISYMVGNITVTVLLAVVTLAALLKLLYIRRKRHYVEHFIYSTHSHAALVFMTIMFVAIYLLFQYQADWLFIILMPYYIVSMRRFYGQGWIKTIFKFFLVAFIYVSFFSTIFLLGAVFTAFLFF